MTSSVEDIRAKIRRADQHIAEFNRLAKSLIESESDPIRYQQDLYTGEYIAISPGFGHTRELSIVIGDCAHQLRSCFDHLVWLAIEQHGKRKPGDGDKLVVSNKNAPSNKTIREREKKMGAGFTEFFESLQPHQVGARYKKHPLWILNQLNVIDKHRLLLTIAPKGYIDSVGLHGVALNDIVVVGGQERELISIEKGAELFRFRIPSGKKPDLDVNLTALIAFQEGFVAQDERVVPLLHKLRDFTAAAVDDFEATLHSN